ncbi:MAG: transposase [Coriobacteriaceae bacterium]|nr:transposase [Coriobacteriaceae bacterium]
MPHIARTKSESGYYHVVPKGIADQLIFEDDLDRSMYLELLRKAKAEAGVKLHAFCLMSNHVHLVVEDEHDKLSEFMKYVTERYAMYYAQQIGRTGGIFRKPFWSEPIESDEYLLCAVRYVHANPAAASICPASAYEWSSAKDYLGRSTEVTDTGMVLDMLGGRDGFVEFSKPSHTTATPFPGSSLTNHLSDDEALAIAKAVLGADGINLAACDKSVRIAGITVLAERGFSIAQISRITGVARSICSYTLSHYLH